MYQCIKSFVNNDNENGLLLLDMPTGFGKTYSVTDYIIDFINDESNIDRKVFFITSLKKNLPIDDLKEKMKAKGLPETSMDKVINLKSNVDMVLQAHKTNQLIFKRVPDEVKRSNEFKKFKDDIEFLNSNLNNKSLKDSIRDNFARNNEVTFRKYVQNILQKKFPSFNDRIYAIKTDSNWQWVGILYPSVFTREKQVIFLSMDKFICPHSTIVEKTYTFYNNNIIKNAVVFIDEFDATKETILKKIISDGLKEKIDYIALFNRIYDVLQRKAFPEKLFIASKERKNGEYSKQDLRSIMDELKDKADGIFKAYCLQFNHKMDNANQKSNNFLFNDHRYITVSNGKNTYIQIQNDKKEKLNHIIFSDTKPVDKNNIQILLGKLRGFVTWFENAVRFFAINYFQLRKENRVNGEEEFTYESAVYSVLSEFNLGEYESYIFSQIMMMRTKVKDNIAGSEYDLTVYENGFRFFTFDNSPNHEFNSIISMTAFSQTPEKILIKLCERAKVIGISATATIPSVLCNYDINYLSNKMGNAFCRISATDYLRLKNKFHSAQIGYDNNVRIQAELLDSSNYSITLWENLFNDRELAQAAHSILVNSLSGTDLNNTYNQERYYKITLAFKRFWENKDIKSFLCLLNKHPRQNDRFLKTSILYTLFSYVTGYQTEDISNMVVFLTGENYDKTKNEITRRLSKGEKLFVISVYQTMGAGQNIQYNVPRSLEHSLYKINDRYNSSKKDFDAIYLDMPTNLVTNLLNESLEDEDFIKYLFETEFLQENGEISEDTAKYNIKRAFERYCYSKPLYNYHNYKTKSVDYYVTRQIIQAIGRICRTNIKNKTVYIFANSEICGSFRTEIAENCLLNSEVLALIKEINKFNIEKSQLDSELINNANLQTARINKFIKNMLVKEWDKKRMEQWIDLRRLVLSYPTVDQNMYKSDFRFSQFFIEMPNKSNVYYYNQEDNYKKITVSFIPSRDYPYTVSEQASRLDKIMLFTGIKQRFEANHWATSFVPNRYNMTPTLFNNIYKGVLGEVVGKYLFDELLGVNLELVNDPEKFELFDYKVSSLPIYVDFKNWHIDTLCDRATMYYKMIHKAKECHAQCVIVANILEDKEDKAAISFYDGIKVVLCGSLLIDNGISVVENKDIFNTIRSCVNEIKNNYK